MHSERSKKRFTASKTIFHVQCNKFGWQQGGNERIMRVYCVQSVCSAYQSVLYLFLLVLKLIRMVGPEVGLTPDADAAALYILTK